MKPEMMATIQKMTAATLSVKGARMNLFTMSAFWETIKTVYGFFAKATLPDRKESCSADRNE